MSLLRILIAGVAVMAASFAFAQDLPPGSDVYVLGEYHDNPAHHAWQAFQIRRLDPAAVVYEMLTPDEAASLVGVARNKTAMVDATAGFLWGDLGVYADVLAASTIIVGAALPAHRVRAAFVEGSASVFGSNAALFGLETPLPIEVLQAREALQFEAHCEAMPRDLMAGMVEAQRLRDAMFAKAVLESLDSYGAPVVLITGNGHARTDWGVPAVLSLVRPDVSVHAVGLSEDGTLEGSFDSLFDAPAPDRGDPCAAFR